MNNFKVMMNGIIKENPTFVLLLGMCPTLGTTSSAINGMGMGLATMFVLICSNVVISLIKNLIPDMVRIPSFIVVIASFVTLLQMVMQAYVPGLYATLGLFIPLIVVNCIVLGRAEAFAAKNNAVASMFDGIGMGLGFTIALTLLGAVREFLGTGKIFDLTIMPEEYGIYIDIYFGNLCKQHRVVAVPGYLSVPGRIQEGGNCDGYERCGCFRVDHRYHRHFPDSEVCTGCFRTGILADDYIHPGDCRIGADGGNHPEKGVSGPVSGVGCVLAADYNKLLYSGCRYPGDSERL